MAAAGLAFWGAVNAITGGAKLEAHLRQSIRNLKRAQKVEVGFFENATYPDGTPVAMVAAINEWGASGAGRGHKVKIPPRPFFRTMIKDGEAHWGPDLGKILKSAEYDAAVALARMGESMKGELQTSIRDWSEPPNAPATIKKKGFDKPLIDTGDMVKRVGSEVT